MSADWPEVALSEILQSIERREEVVPGKVYRQIGVKLWGMGAYEREPLEGSQTRYKTLSSVEADDVIVNKIWARNGSVAVVTEDLAGCYGSNEFPTFAPFREKILPRWFHWFTKTPGFWSQCDEKSRGTSGKNRIRPERFLEIEIPLPPLDEQRRTVVRIEELAAKIEEAQKLRRQAAEEADGLVSTYLGKMFEQKKTVVGTLGEGIESARNGISRRPTGIESGPIVLRLADVSDGKVNLTNPRRGYLSDDEIETYGLLSEDLLFVRVNGSKNIVGRCIPFIGAKEQVCFNDHLIRVRLNQTIFDWRFVAKMANSPISREYIIKTAITTAGQLTINQKMLANIPIPILPLPEQRRIVARLDELQARVDGLRKHQVRTAEELDALLPAVLDRAFRGQL